MKRDILTACLVAALFALPMAVIPVLPSVHGDTHDYTQSQLAQGQSWHAFAAVQIEEPPPRPVEGKKHRDRKHQDEEEPTPAPAPEPDALPEPVPPKPEVDPEFGEVYPEGKRPKPLPQPDRHVKPEKPNRDSHDTKVVNTVVYRTSWFPSLYELVALSLSALNLYIARRQGFDFRTLFTFWK